MQVRVAVRGNLITLQGEADRRSLAERLIRQLLDLIARGQSLSRAEVAHAAEMVAKGDSRDVREFLLDTVLVSVRRRPITPRSPNQKAYVDAIRNHDVVFGIGPAGTGKTYMAVAMAVAALQAGEVRRIILTRPAVEAGEKLGYLPGDLAEKVNPYLRPLYDALHDMIEPSKCLRMMDQGVIEVAPLAFMRGRTLSNAFIILDEAQNTTPQQMKMFLTRLGVDSRVVVTGDVTQIDLPERAVSGLLEVRGILSGVPDVPFIQFSHQDVVRHPLVRRIIEAYERAERSADPARWKAQGRRQLGGKSGDEGEPPVEAKDDAVP
ncbi:MAG: phosphate starvation-inducible protein PhoH [Deltaproteobacteria bacterium]|nr:phosphate starvation-inducible protein PhoH [Deltaproteobacteria bacterium]